MTPAKLKRKTKNRMLTHAKATLTLMSQDYMPEDALDILHDLAMRCYAEGWTHGEAAQREKEESKP